jgi:hypothetical protein
MFRIIELTGLPNELELEKSCLVEYLCDLDKTFIYIFNPFEFKWIVSKLNKMNRNYFVQPQTFHAAYKSKLFYQEGRIENEGIPLLQHYQLPEPPHQLFIEIKQRRNRIKEIVTYTSINDLKQILKNHYELKFVVPFYYLREMKEYEKEKKIKIDQLDQLYIIEYKALQGLKR